MRGNIHFDTIHTELGSSEHLNRVTHTVNTEKEHTATQGRVISHALCATEQHITLWVASVEETTTHGHQYQPPDPQQREPENT